MTTKLTLITGNAKKAEHLAELLDIPLTHQAIDLPEIQSLAVETIAIEKAKTAYQHVDSPVIVEDTALSFTALGGLPGPFIKWFLDTIGSDGLCRLLADYTDRSAVATTCLALYDGETVRTFVGEATGKIATVPAGTTDFGWNNIFIPDGQEQTWAEMATADIHKDSMRSRAAAALKAHLTAESS